MISLKSIFLPQLNEGRNYLFCWLLFPWCSEQCVHSKYIGIPGFLVLCFIELYRCYVFTKWRFVATLPSASIWVPFSNSLFSLGVSVSSCGNSCSYLSWKIFSSLSYLLWWSVICDLRCHFRNCFRAPRMVPIWDGKQNKCYVCSDCSTDRPFPLHSTSPPTYIIRYDSA